MIIAFAPDQVHEVAQAFDAPWFFSESLYPDTESSYPTYIHRENTGNDEKTEKESSYPTYIHKEKTSKDEKKDKATPNEDAKPAAKESPEKSKKACRRNAHCSSNVFHPYHCFYRAARCAQQAADRQAQAAANTIEQRNPIHYHDETPQLAKMSLDITGFTSEDITINVEDFVVSISGKRTNRLGDVFVIDRKFRLDKKTVNLDSVTASFEDGILELIVPKKASVGPRTIPISVSSSGSASTASVSHETEISNSVHSVKEENNAVNSAEEEEQTQSPEEASLDGNSDDTQERVSVKVETVQENERNNEQAYDQQTQSNPDILANKSAEDEAWEEVSE